MRLPFDPERAVGAEPVPEGCAVQRSEAADEAGCLTVSQLSEIIRETLEGVIVSPLRVVGEVSNLSTPGHFFFSLKDENAIISCVAWASSARRFSFTPKDGDQVIATGHVSHYGPQGRTQLYVSDLKAVGAGDLERRFRAMCDELRRLGYFAEERKKRLPPFPRRIAVITSAQGAAVQDVISTAAHRCRAVALLIVDVRVQGDGAAAEVARAIRWVDAGAERLGVDAILVTRGGGSVEDLWTFNEREVADAIYACRLPVVAAIGHESDTTVAELVADLRAATPTQAAMRLVPSAQELARQVAHLDSRLHLLLSRSLERQRDRLAHHRRHLHAAVRHLVSDRRARLERLAGHLAALRPAELAGRRLQRLAVLEDRLGRALSSRVQRLGERLEQLGRRLAAVDPRSVLGRGFTYTTRGGGALVRSTADVRAGEAIRTHVADGEIESVVGGAAARPPRRAGAGRGPRDQMDLFGRSG